ncbi:MAG: UDP-N-acetylmuramoyl-L-alanyl-D-glutamate--2,6-diaminopimelate ligase [Kiloniellales bacterium]
MRLTALLQGGEAKVQAAEALKDPDIVGLAADSRRVRPGYLFAALPGTRLDGRDFIDQAIERGAVAVLAPPGTAVARPVPLVADADPRRGLALMAARFYGPQPHTVAAVTGTNGKTSVASFTRQIWAAAGHRAAALGTLGITAAHLGRSVAPAGRLTTPDPVALHAELKGLAAAGVEHLALEASSHGLDQRRLDGVRVAAAGFTNLGRDHLDYHGSMHAYFAAKRRLFDQVMAPGGVAVLNADAPRYAALSRVCQARRHRVISFGRKGADIRLDGITPQAGGQRLEVTVFGEAQTMPLPMVGTFQAFNVLCALGLAVSTGVEPSAALAACARLVGVPGRLERAAVHPRGAPIYVDYAHTPDALETVLAALRRHVHGRLIVVFGCGGERDRGKRPLMGRIAERLADEVVVTDDNPRGEDPAAIRRQILGGCRRAREIGDRAEAIRAAAEPLKAEDLLLIAGKGHESGQIVGQRVLPFDEVEVARRVVGALPAARDDG